MISVDQAQKMVLDQVAAPKSSTKYQKWAIGLYFISDADFQCLTMMREEVGVRVLATEKVNFRSALGRVLCQEVKANWETGSNIPLKELYPSP